jgi:transposase
VRVHVVLGYIRRLYQIERQAKDLFAKQEDGPDTRPLAAIRLELRQQRSLPVLKELEAHLRQQAAGIGADGRSLPSGPVLPKSPLGMATTYCLGNWQALVRYTDDGQLDIDNNVAERQMRPVACGRANWTFLGSDNGGHTAAVLYSLVATAKRHGLDPFAYLRDVIARISDHPASKLEELLPDHWKLSRTVPPPEPT